MQKHHNCPNLPAQQPTMLTASGVAAMLACSPRSVYRLADSGRIPPPVRFGGLVRWPRAVLEQWIADGCPVPTNGQNLAKKAAEIL